MGARATSEGDSFCANRCTVPHGAGNEDEDVQDDDDESNGPPNAVHRCVQIC